MRNRLTVCAIGIVLAACGGGGGNDSGGPSVGIGGSGGSGASSFAGQWTVLYAGNRQGQCSNIVIASNGSLTGQCVQTNGSNFPVTGVVNSEGEIDFANSASGIRFDGQIANASGSGTWEVDGSDDEGTWTMTKQ